MTASATRTTCPYCGVGCGVLATRAANAVSFEITGDPQHPANLGKLCSKGSALGQTLRHTDRLLYPQVGGQRVTWSEALDRVAGGLRETMERHGPHSVALYVSANHR